MAIYKDTPDPEASEGTYTEDGHTIRVLYANLVIPVSLDFTSKMFIDIKRTSSYTGFLKKTIVLLATDKTKECSVESK